jgi:hypothetical protein
MEDAINSHHAGSNTDCIANWILAKRWIKDCRDNHVRCSQVRDVSWVPTRLVGLGPAEQDMRPRLKGFADHRGSVEYTALSHCWEGANIHKLQKANLAFLSADIPLNYLPKRSKMLCPSRESLVSGTFGSILYASSRTQRMIGAKKPPRWEWCIQTRL